MREPTNLPATVQGVDAIELQLTAVAPELHHDPLLGLQQPCKFRSKTTCHVAAVTGDRALVGEVQHAMVGDSFAT